MTQNLNKLSSLFRGFQQAGQLVRNALIAAIGLTPETQDADLGVSASPFRVSRRDLQRVDNVRAVRRKLGASWFTRSISPRYRAKRLRSLNKEELHVAISQGWVS